MLLGFGNRDIEQLRASQKWEKARNAIDKGIGVSRTMIHTSNSVAKYKTRAFLAICKQEIRKGTHQ